MINTPDLPKINLSEVSGVTQTLSTEAKHTGWRGVLKDRIGQFTQRSKENPDNVIETAASGKITDVLDISSTTETLPVATNESGVIVQADQEAPRDTPREILAQLPAELRESAQTLFDVLDIINNPPESVDSAGRSPTAAEAITKLNGAISKFRQAGMDRESLLDVAREISIARKQCDLIIAKTDQQRQQDQAELVRAISEIEAPLKTSPEGTTLNIDQIRSNAYEALRREQAKSPLTRPFRSKQIEELKRRVLQVDEVISRKKAMQVEHDERDNQRREVLKLLSNSETLDQIKDSIIQDSSGILYEIHRGLDRRVEQLTHDEKYLAGVVSLVVRGTLPIDDLIKAGRLEQTDIDEFERLVTNSLLRREVAGDREKKQALDQKTNFIFREIEEVLRPGVIADVLEVVSLKNKAAAEGILTRAVSVVALSEEQKKHIEEQIHSGFNLGESDQRIISNWMRRLVDTGGLRKNNLTLLLSAIEEAKSESALVATTFSRLEQAVRILRSEKYPPADALFDFFIEIKSWPDDWVDKFNISEIPGIDNRLQWANLSLERRKALLKSELTEQEKEELVKNDAISSEYISRQYTLLLIRNVLKHVVEDSLDENKKSQADTRNREFVISERQPLVPGTFLQGTSISALRGILHTGTRSGEFLGLQQVRDGTPFGCDFSEVQLEDITFPRNSDTEKHAALELRSRGRPSVSVDEVLETLRRTKEFARAYYLGIAAGYGAKPDIDRGGASDSKVNEDDTGITLIFDRSRTDAFLRGMEYAGHMRTTKVISSAVRYNVDFKHHQVIPVGLPGTEVFGLVINGRATQTLKRAEEEIIENGFYIPIYDVDGTLLFTPENYDQQRSTLRKVG